MANQRTWQRARLARGGAAVALAAMLALAGGAAQWAWGQQAAQGVVKAGAAGNGMGPSKPAATAKPMPLVVADPELPTYLDRLSALIESKSYSDALRLLQTLIDQGSGFYDDSTDGRHYVSYIHKINEILAHLPEEALELYQSTNDAEAAAMLEKAQATGDENLLYQVVHRFLYTHSGGPALDAIAAGQFDAGRFSQAARNWLRLSMLHGQENRQALLRAKAAVAYFLDGDAASGEKLLKELADQNPQAQGELSGQTQNLLEFAQSARLLRAATGSKVYSSKNWPGWGAIGRGYAPTADFAVILTPWWSSDNLSKLSDRDELSKRLLVSREDLFGNMPEAISSKAEVNIRDGQVQIRQTQGRIDVQQVQGYWELSTTSRILPPIIQPVIVSDTVIYRTASGLTAVDIVTGRQKWVNEQPDLAMNHSQTASRGQYYGYNQATYDKGRYALTVGGAMVFGVGDIPLQLDLARQTFAGGDKKTSDETGSTRLFAISLDQEGKMVWRVGRGDGDDIVLRESAFLNAPAYADGRVYALCIFRKTQYFLVCLNASDGSLVWKLAIAQVPMGPLSGWQNNAVLDAASPPAVVDGRVYALTNAGVLTAVDASSGKPLWAYQYPQTERVIIASPQQGDPRAMVQMPNPLIVARGRVIAMPMETSQLLAVSCEDGTPVWSCDRGKLTTLSGIDEDRLALSGGGLQVRSTLTGEVLFTGGEALSDTLGRPAVTDRAILISGKRKIHRVDLNGYASTQQELIDANGVLGNLISSGGRLVAANPAGICAYLPYADARQRLTEELENSPADDKASVLMRRALLLYHGGNVEEALGDYQAAGEQARRSGGESLAAQARQGQYRCYIALANHSPTPRTMIDIFLKAKAIADSPMEQAQIRLRLAKAFELAGQYPEAAAVAQELIGEQFVRQRIVDDVIGDKAHSKAWFEENAPTLPAGTWARQFISRLIRDHGPSCYAPFESQAVAAYQNARARSSIVDLESVYRQWPNSAVAIEAMLTAAEISYRSAASQPAKDAQPHWEETISFLGRASASASSPRQAIAIAALAELHARQGRPGYAAIVLDRLSQLPAETPIAFADIHGTLGELRQRIEQPRTTTAPATIIDVQRVQTPLREVYSFKENTSILVRDQNEQPLRIGESLLVLKGQQAVLFNSAEADEEQAIQWTALLPAPARLGGETAGGSGGRLVGGVSADGKTLAVINGAFMAGYELRSGKLLWRQTPKTLGVGDIYSMGVGQGRGVVIDTTGQVMCIRLADGQILWKNRVSKFNNVDMSRRGNIIGVNPPLLTSDMAVFVSDESRLLTVIDVTSGKLLAQWQGDARVEAMACGEGLLATLIDGELALRERSNLNKPVWSRTLRGKTASVTPMLLAADRQRLAVLPNKVLGAIEIIPLVGDGRSSMTLSTKDAEGKSAVPLWATMNGEDLVVLAGAQRGPTLLDLTRGAMFCTSPMAMKFHLGESGDPLWVSKLAQDAPEPFQIMPGCLGEGHLAVTIKTVQRGSNAELLVLDGADGGIRERIALSGKDIGDNEKRSRHGLVGAPVMTDGRLSVETYEGVTVYGN